MRKHPTKPPSLPKALRFSGRPGYLLLIIAATIFVSELLVMIFLEYLPPLIPYQEALFDAALLSTIVFPTLYFLAFKPLTTNIAIRQRTEEEKNTLIIELEKALAEVKTLQGIIPICSSCKKIRDDEGFWQQVDVYVSKHSAAQFSHGICDECLKKLYPEEYAVINKGGFKFEVQHD